MNVYLVPNTSKNEAMQVARKAGRILAEEGVHLMSDDRSGQLALEGWVGAIMPSAEAYRRADIVLTIGGDGTMLHAARHTMLYKTPLLGINIGRLGFLTNVESDELEKLRRLPRGEYLVEERSVLRAEVAGAPKPPWLALNDVVLSKDSPERAIVLDIYCDDILVSTVRGDGVIFATPTGSTAYTMSAGGPILDARLGGIVVTQICAHVVHTPPLVFAADRVIKVIPRGNPDEKVVVICDGEKGSVLRKDEPVYIRQSERTVPLIQFNGAEQLEFIDKKLKGR